jgi:hypothetical protein
MVAAEAPDISQALFGAISASGVFQRPLLIALSDVITVLA